MPQLIYQSKLMNLFFQKVKIFFTMRKQIIIALIFITLFSLFVFWISTPPKNFQENFIVDIEEGETVNSVSNVLKENNIIKSKILFSLLIEMSRSHVVVGRYIFKTPENLFTVVRRVARGNYGSATVQFTFFEGMTSQDMAKAIKFYFPNFDDNEFIALAKEKEGYLFPDTYKITDLMSPRQVIKILEDNFNDHMVEIEEVIKNSKYSLSQIIIMASIIEKEATADSRQEVSNILWKRYEDDMLLQVDAPFVYSIGKGTFDLTKDDLRSDDAFNTYTNKGLVPSPISNPGLESIKAAANPQETKNYYFLTGRDGEMYYAKTFEEHKKNRLLYLD
jgi:UPF0755 protein